MSTPGDELDRPWCDCDIFSLEARAKADPTRRGPGAYHMKLVGFLLLAAGWVIVLAAVVLLASALPRTGFVLAGLAVEALGLIVVARAHWVLRGEKG